MFISVTADINNKGLDSLIKEIGSYKKSSFGSISTYPAFSYVSDAGGAIIYLVELGNFNNVKLSIMFTAIADIIDSTVTEQTEEIVKSLAIDKNNILSAINTISSKEREVIVSNNDGLVKKVLENLRAETELFYQKMYSYAGFCRSNEYNNGVENILNQSKLYCKDSANAYLITASISDGYWCIDSRSNQIKVSSSVGAGESCVK